MRKGRTDDQWWHTANLLWMTAEMNRDRKTKPEPFTPLDFHLPTLAEKQTKKVKDKAEVKRVPISELKAMFSPCQQTAQSEQEKPT